MAVDLEVGLDSAGLEATRLDPVQPSAIRHQLLGLMELGTYLASSFQRGPQAKAVVQVDNLALQSQELSIHSDMIV